MCTLHAVHANARFEFFHCFETYFWVYTIVSVVLPVRFTWFTQHNNVLWLLFFLRVGISVYVVQIVFHTFKDQIKLN